MPRRRMRTMAMLRVRLMTLIRKTSQRKKTLTMPKAVTMKSTQRLPLRRNREKTRAESVRVRF